MQYDPGRGDYSKERHAMFDDLTLDDLLDAIERPRPEDDRGSA